MDNQEIAADLEQIAEEIMELCRQAYDMLPPGDAKNRARSYWYGHIMSAIGSDDYPSGSATSMMDTVRELQEGGYEESTETSIDPVVEGENDADLEYMKSLLAKWR